MIKITDNNREKIQEAYVSDLMDSMDWDTLYAYAYENLMESKGLMTNEALELEIVDYSPYILDG